jgi:DNA-directed RNA polymerase specialized sigma24 family protein
MTDSLDKTLERAGEWTLTKDSLQRLLNWLDGSADSDGHAYVEMRRRLRDYFARKSCRAADDLADETLTRVAPDSRRRASRSPRLPARYCYIVARFVFLELLELVEIDDPAVADGVGDHRRQHLRGQDAHRHDHFRFDWTASS